MELIMTLAVSDKLLQILRILEEKSEISKVLSLLILRVKSLFRRQVCYSQGAKSITTTVELDIEFLILCVVK